MSTIELQRPSPATADRAWPVRHQVLGIPVSATNYAEASDAILAAARRGDSGVVAAYAVHAVVTAARDVRLRQAVQRFDMITPDGQPVRWALNWLYGAGLRDRVYGPELMLRICRDAARDGVGVYLYGGADEALLDELVERLGLLAPGLRILGREAPPFRQLRDDELDAMAERVHASGAGIVFIGLGCPKQDWFAVRQADRIRAVQVLVGAAFDFHAGRKPMAPAWMQRRGLEWFYRLTQEPGRLWKRYLVTNTQFVSMFTWQWLFGPRRSDRAE